MSAKKARSYEKNFEVAAPPEAVWKAITEGDELVRWFCQKATCESGVGGKHHVDWGGGAKGTSTIVIWQPGVHLRTEADRPDLSRPAAGDPSEPYAVDWFLEGDGGITRVRMVASGFGEGLDWDHEYDGTFHGWDMFHKTLKHYLEIHRGKPAQNVVAYAMLAVPPAEAWNRLMSPEGLVKEGRLDNLSIGAPFRFVTAAGDVFAGVVQNYVPGKTFSAMVESLNKAILILEMASMPGHGHFLYLSLSTWGLPKADVDALGARIKSIVYGLFPQKTDEPKSACAVQAPEPAPSEGGL
jgi:uncharacterized protein YndB with AHSA1/START domain